MYSRIIPGRLDRRSSVRRTSAFNWNFASLFPGAYQVLQSDRGLTYGGTPLPTAGNTSTTALTLTGTLATTPIPIRVTCIAAGTIGDLVSEFTISLDGGFTISQVITAPAVGVPVALTGAAAGLSVTFSAGTCVLNDTWSATCAALADQSVNGKHAAQAGATLQPIVTPGLNGKPGLLFDGVNDYLQSTVGTLLSFPYLIILIGRVTALSSGNNALVSGAPGVYAGTIYQSSGTQFSQYSSGPGNAVTFSALTNQRWAAVFANSANPVTGDSLKVGSLAAVSGANAGAAASATRTIGASGDPGQFAAAEIFAVIYTPVVPYAAFDAALNSSGGYGPGAIGI